MRPVPQWTKAISHRVKRPPQWAKGVPQWAKGVPRHVKGAPHGIKEQWARGRWVRIALCAGVIAVLALIGVLVAPLVVRPFQPSRGDLVRLVQQGDPTIDAARAGCIVDTMRKSLTPGRTEQILKRSGRQITADEEKLVVTAAVTCSGTSDINLAAHERTASPPKSPVRIMQIICLAVALAALLVVGIALFVHRSRSAKPADRPHNAEEDVDHPAT